MINRMSYLYTKPTITLKSSHPAVQSRSDPACKECFTVLEEESKEKVNVIGSNITEISYEEHLKNLEFMCKTDREFMKRVRSFCEENASERESVRVPQSAKPSGADPLQGRIPTLREIVIEPASLNKKPPVDSEDENHHGRMAGNDSKANH